MKITPLEIRGHQFRKTLRGYDTGEVEKMMEMAAMAIEDAAREISDLEGRLRESSRQLSEHIANERVLKEAITTTQRMVEDLRKSAQKEADLLVTEARLQAEEIVRQAHSRSIAMQEDIYRLRQKRQEILSAIKSIIDYHSTTLLLDEDETEKPQEADNLKFFKK